MGSTSQFVNDLLHSTEVDNIPDGETREVSVVVTDINNATSEPSIATITYDTSHQDSSITGFTPIVDASGNWVAFDGSGSVIANTVGLGVNIDDSEPFSDVTALLKAANIITADQEAQGSFHGELTQDNMAKLLQEAGKNRLLICRHLLS